MNWRPLIGILLNGEMWTFLFLNLLCLYCIQRGRLYANKENPVYLITSFNLVCDLFQLLVHVVYMGPSIFLGSWMFEGQDSLGVTLAATWFLGFWFLGSLIQILMAANRLFIVLIPETKVLTHGRLLVIMFLCVVASLAGALWTQILSPCCRITSDYRLYAYSFFNFTPGMNNPSMDYIDFPIDVVTTIVCVLSYGVLFGYVYQMDCGQLGARKREIRICIQFLIIFLAYSITWSTFFFFPMLGVTNPEVYTVTSFVFMANCGANAVIYLTMNKEIKSQLSKLVGKVSASSSVYNISTTHGISQSQSQLEN